VIVQHMTEGFIGGMAKWLADTCPDIKVMLVAHDTVPVPGIVYLASDDCHLEYRRGSLVTNDDHPEHLHKPSIDVFFESVADAGAAACATAVLLTGMGADGAQGLLKIRQAGSSTIAQDEASSVVYGMPGVAAKIGAAEHVLSLERIGPHLRRIVTNAGSVAATS
jgi:chemotaxis response regulator CheB